jgi:CRISPR-associated protein Csm3
MAEETEEKPKALKLLAKLFITGTLVTQTGLHIGGDKSTLDIGSVDLNVIKDDRGNPYIPGSSLKGKLRSMLAKIVGSIDPYNDYKISQNSSIDITGIFGYSGSGKEKGDVTRLQVRDAHLATTAKIDTEIKWENTIDRLKGTAKDPRQLERVPPNTRFNVCFVYDYYDDAINGNKGSHRNVYEHLRCLSVAMRLLQDDYLGGSGSRGYGVIEFDNLKVSARTIDKWYKATGEKLEIEITTDFLNALPKQKELEAKLVS